MVYKYPWFLFVRKIFLHPFILMYHTENSFLKNYQTKSPTRSFEPIHEVFFFFLIISVSDQAKAAVKDGGGGGGGGSGRAASVGKTICQIFPFESSN